MLSETTQRKFVNSIDVDEWEVETESGWSSIDSIHKTIEYDVWEIELDNGLHLECADTHILIDEDGNEVFAKDSLNTTIKTKQGNSKVIRVSEFDKKENMYDMSIDSDDHTYYTNDILSHNTTTAAAVILHYILFNEHKLVGLLANKGDSAREILDRIKIAYEALPKWLQQGVIEWNKGSVEFENGSKIVAAATSSSAIRGKSVSFLYIDETAFVENWDEFFAAVLPTISSGKTTKILLTSTPNGMNHFYKTCNGAKEGTNGYKYVEVPWQDVPGRDDEWKKETLASMDFDVQKFAQEYECQFLGSSNTLIEGSKLKTLVSKTPIKEGQGISMYAEPEEGRSYACIVDVSRGKGLDYSAFQIIDVTEMPYKQVCVFRDNFIPPVEYAEIIYRTATLYNEATCLIEINDIGEQVSELLHFDFEYENILFTESAGRAGRRISAGFSKGIDKGIRTTKTVKSVGCSILKLLIEQDQLIIQDHNTINELSRFSRKGSSYEAESGSHDDLVMCLVLFAWLSNQAYFKDITDIQTLSRLRERTEEDLMNDLLPFGIHDDGIDEVEAIDVPQHNDWMMDQEDRFNPNW